MVAAAVESWIASAVAVAETVEVEVGSAVEDIVAAGVAVVAVAKGVEPDVAATIAVVVADVPTIAPLLQYPVQKQPMFLALLLLRVAVALTVVSTGAAPPAGSFDAEVA